MSLRVVHVDTASSWRGGQNQVLLTARGMAAAGHTVAVACRRGGELEARVRAAGLEAWALPFGADVAPAAIFGLARRLRSFGPSVVQLHDPHAVASGVLARLLAPRGRLVATRRVDFALRGPLSRLKYTSVERVVAVSHAIARALVASGLETAKVRVVHEGVPDRPRPAGAREALAALGIPAGAPVVGNVAALVDHKDHDTLLAAWAHVVASIPAARLLILGEGELRPRLEARSRALGIDGAVVFAGFRSDVDVLLAGCDLFCLSSHMEGLGTSLLDAMSFGLPVVATAAGGIPEAVQDSVTGRLVPVRDADALGAALVNLLGDAEGRARMSRAGRERYLARFSTERMVQATLDVYRELVP